MHTSFLPEYKIFQFCPDIHSLNKNDIEKWLLVHFSKRRQKYFYGRVSPLFFRGGGHLVDKYGKTSGDFFDPFWPLGGSESKILSKFGGPKRPSVVEISADLGDFWVRKKFPTHFWKYLDYCCRYLSTPKIVSLLQIHKKLFKPIKKVAQNCNAKHFGFPWQNIDKICRCRDKEDKK